VFDGLAESDTLIVMLSAASVRSRWVREELNSAIMRRLSDNGIRILPILIETCNIPLALKHIKYADFRKKREEALFRLVDSLAPGRMIWKSLEHLYDHFCLLCEQISPASSDHDVRKWL